VKPGRGGANEQIRPATLAGQRSIQASLTPHLSINRSLLFPQTSLHFSSLQRIDKRRPKHPPHDIAVWEVS
jgi:hypothetical protein